MKGRSLEELDEIFEARTPALKFKDYQCTIRDEAAFEVQEKTGVVIEKAELVGTHVETADMERAK